MLLLPRLITLVLLTTLHLGNQAGAWAQPVHQDIPFAQKFSVKYYAEKEDISFRGLACDRKGVVEVLAPSGELLHPVGGALLLPGTLGPSRRYRPLGDRKLRAIGLHQDQLVYLDEKAVFSNAWAGRLDQAHELPGAKLFAGGTGFDFLVSDGKTLHLLGEKGVLWRGSLPGNEAVTAIRHRTATGEFWVMGEHTIYRLRTNEPTLIPMFKGEGFTAFAFADAERKLIAGTHNGYQVFDLVGQTPVGALKRRLPATDITAVAQINGQLWFGSTQGAFSRRADGGYDYYQGERWLPGNRIYGLSAGPGGSVLLLTGAGLARLESQQMTLAQKAQFYEHQVRTRHLRHGFNASLEGMQKGNLATGYLADADNDGLWTAMYLAGQVFRYAVTKEKEALQNCRESLEAMERLYTLTPIPGFPARAIERAGYISQLNDPERWQHSPQPGWDWKATTSSDEAIGHVFVFGVMAELISDAPLRNKAVMLLDTLMTHILDHDLYLVDFDGKPTRWGRWNPAYVNALPTNVGDRKLNSSNIIAMLQTAYRFTKKEKYRRKALELMQRHGYLENLLRPMSQIGQASEDADATSKLLSDGWNHSDDEMYFLGYWGLYRYALDEKLRASYKKAILDHWTLERPEKEAAWNLFTALTGTNTFDLKEAIWYLQEYPLDLIDWAVVNSGRKDIDRLPDNFRGQTTRTVLPPGERPLARHNSNTFILDRTAGSGTREYSAGDTWLLPYWMGRYLGVIGPAAKK